LSPGLDLDMFGALCLFFEISKPHGLRSLVGPVTKSSFCAAFQEFYPPEKLIN